MEKREGPSFRVIGNASEEAKKKVVEERERAFSDHFESMSPEERGALEKFEYPKTEKEIALINFANEETNRLMAEFGLQGFDVPEKNYHLVPPEVYKKTDNDGGSRAHANYRKQGILLNAQFFRNKPLSFGSTVLHETLHLKSKQSIEVSKIGSAIKDTTYRAGVSTWSLQKHDKEDHDHKHFGGLHEAIVATQEQKSFNRILEIPELKDDRDWMLSEEAIILKKKIAKEQDIKETDIIWVNKDVPQEYEAINYPREREVLSYICEEIQKQFPEQYKDSDEVFKEFLKSNFNGNLMTIGRLVEQTFGDGGFRLLSNMQPGWANSNLHLEALKKARARQVKAAL